MKEPWKTEAETAVVQPHARDAWSHQNLREAEVPSLEPQEEARPANA